MYSDKHAKLGSPRNRKITLQTYNRPVTQTTENRHPSLSSFFSFFFFLLLLFFVFLSNGLLTHRDSSTLLVSVRPGRTVGLLDDTSSLREEQLDVTVGCRGDRVIVTARDEKRAAPSERAKLEVSERVAQYAKIPSLTGQWQIWSDE